MLAGPGCIAKPNGLPNNQIAVACRGQASLPPKIPSPAPYFGSILADKPFEPPNQCSANVLTEEVPSWFEELLNEPDSPASRSHRRSASDPFACLALGGPHWGFQTTPYGPPYQNGPTRKPNQLHDQRDKLRKSVAGSEEDAELKALGVSCTTPDLDVDSRNGSEHSSGGSDCSQMKPPLGPKPDVKRKQHNARRSRVRKLQYTAELERSAHVLQMEGVEVTAQLEFLDQQNMILALENRALKQRLESLSQEHYIKSLEQELLDRELARLQYLYHFQNTNQHQLRQRQKQAAAHRRGRSCDIDSQFAKLHLHPQVGVTTSNGFKEPQRN